MSYAAGHRDLGLERSSVAGPGEDLQGGGTAGADRSVEVVRDHECSEQLPTQYGITLRPDVRLEVHLHRRE